MNAEQQKILTELQDAVATTDIITIADSISDLFYIVYGTSYVIDVEPIYEEPLIKIGDSTITYNMTFVKN